MRSTSIALIIIGLFFALFSAGCESNGKFADNVSNCIELDSHHRGEISEDWARYKVEEKKRVSNTKENISDAYENCMDTSDLNGSAWEDIKAAFRNEKTKWPKFSPATEE